MTPTEHQSFLLEHEPPKQRSGLDRLAHGLVGRLQSVFWVKSKLAIVARQIVAEREVLRGLTDAHLDAKLIQIRQARRRTPDKYQDNEVNGLAAIAVCAERELGLKAYEVQLMAAAALVKGFLIEVDTGEGKTLAIGIAAAFHAWSGLPCHVITANDYLAERDALYLKRFYKRLGISVGSVIGESQEEERRTAYGSAITYTTAKEVAADYLRDRIRLEGIQSISRLVATVADRSNGINPVQRGLYWAFIDEADHALIDEAVTPLIISRTTDADEMVAASRAVWSLVKDLKSDVHYRLDRPRKYVELLQPGMDQALNHLGLPHDGLWGSKRRRIELVRQGIEAREYFLRDEQYILDDGKVVIVDPATGRPMPMRTWRQGLHQIIEAKENLEITGTSETLARISFQTYFRKYKQLAGASGTLREVAAELWHTYNTPFLSIPRNLTCQRTYAGLKFYKNADEQETGLIHELKTRHSRGQPILIGTRTVAASEQVAALLRGHRLPGGDQVLNARHHREEAILVSQAGKLSKITIATSMAGRGTDIILEDGGRLLGGLHVISIEAHESARVDRQLIGRSARQGDPGSVIMIYNTEDEVFKRFVPETLLRWWRISLRWNILGDIPQWFGWALIHWSQFRAQSFAAKSRRALTTSEAEITRSLGFTVGREQQRISYQEENFYNGILKKSFTSKGMS